MLTSQTMEPDLSLVLPAYNEEHRLPRTLSELATFAREFGKKLEVIVVSDGSEDDTCGVAHRWARQETEEFLQVRVTQIPHRGKGAAVRAGMELATAPVVGFSDVDLSAGVDALKTLFSEALDGRQIVIASRGLSESILEVRQPWYRERAGRLFNLFLRKLANTQLSDTQCGLKLFQADVARKIFRHQRLDGFAFDAELMVLADRLGFEVKEVPIRWVHDPESKVALARDGIDMVVDVFRIVRRLRRGGVHALGILSSDALDRMIRSENIHWWYRAKRKLVMDLLDAEPPGNCLDVGCGGGATLAESLGSKRGFGIDLAPAPLRHARSRGLNRLARAEGSALPFSSHSFGTVLALDVVEHHPRPELLLKEIKRVLSPQGVALITVPAFQWMWSYADHVLGHYRRYTKEQLVSELERTGFLVQKATYFHSWLLPIAWLFRRIRSLAGKTDSADDFPLPRLIDGIFFRLAAWELGFVRKRDLPFGLSVLAVVRPAADRSPQSMGSGGGRIAPPVPKAVVSSGSRI